MRDQQNEGKQMIENQFTCMLTDRLMNQIWLMLKGSYSGDESALVKSIKTQDPVTDTLQMQDGSNFLSSREDIGVLYSML